MHRVLAISLVLVLSCESSYAASYTWNGTGNSNATNGWGTSTDWNSSGIPGAGDTITFNGTGSSSATVTLGGNQAIGGISIATGATGPTTITSGGVAGYALTVGSGGITQAASTGTVTLGSTSAANNFTISLGASQTWSNASSNPLLVYANLNGTAATSSTQTLTTGGAGNITLAGGLGDGAGGGHLAVNAAGSGSLILSGADTYSGTTTASSGTLQFNGSSAMSSNSALSLASGSTLALASDTSATFSPASIASFSSSTTLNFVVSNIATGSSNTLTLSGTLNFASSTANTINVAGSNGYTLALGAINVPSGSGSSLTNTLAINANSANVTTGAIEMGAYGEGVIFGGSDAVTVDHFDENSNGSNTVTVGNGSNTPTVAISNATTNAESNRSEGSLGFVVNSGTLSVNNAGILNNPGSTTATVAVNAGTLILNGATAMGSNAAAITLNNNSTLELLGNTSTSYTPNSLTLASGTNTFNFAVNNAGSGSSNTLTLTSTLTLPTSTGSSVTDDTVNITGGNGYTLALGGVNASSSAGSDSTNLLTFNATGANLSTGTISLGSYGEGLSFDGTKTITVNAIGLGSNGTDAIVIGNGSDSPTVTIQNATFGFNTRNSGNLSFTLNSGVLQINNAGVFNDGGSGGTSGFTINGGTIDNTSGGSIYTAATLNTLILSGNFAFSTAAGTALNDIDLVSSSIRDTQPALTITLNGGGVLTLSGSAFLNYTTGNQTLTVNNGSGTGSGTALTLSGYDLSTTPSTGRSDIINGSGNVNITGAIVDTSSGTAVSSLTYSGNGTLTLSGANTYSGTTTISSGVVQLGAGGTSGSLASTGTITDNGSLVFDRSNAMAQGTDFSSSPISGTGSIIQAGSGTTTLNAANTYSGGTSITAGELIANVGGSGSSSSSALGQGTGTATIAGGTLLIGSTSSSSSVYDFYNPIILNSGVFEANDGYTHEEGPVTLNGGTLSSLYDDTGSGGSRKGLWIDGSISGSGNVTVAYLGSGTSDYNGTIVRITSSGNSYSGTITVNPSSNDGGTYLYLDSASALPNAVLNLTGNNSGTIYNGTNGTLQLGDYTLVFGTSVTSEAINGLEGSGGVVLQQVTPDSNPTGAAVTLTVGGGSTPVSTTYSGVMSGTGGLIKAGSGTLALSSATGNTYSGGTTVSGGVLVALNTSGSATGTGSLTVNAGATLAGTGTVTASAAGSNTISITGTGTATNARANVLVGLTSATDTTLGTKMGLNATGGMTLTNANLTFNLSSSSVGTDTQLSVGSTAVAFTSGARSTILSLNLEGNSIIPANSGYVLIAGTGNTVISGGTSGTTSGQFAGLTVSENSLGQEVITGSGTTGSGNLALSLSGLAGAYYANSYLILVDNVNGPSSGDEIEVEVVPEPGTWALTLEGLATLVFWQRRKRS